SRTLFGWRRRARAGPGWTRPGWAGPGWGGLDRAGPGWDGPGWARLAGAGRPKRPGCIGHIPGRRHGTDRQIRQLAHRPAADAPVAGLRPGAVRGAQRRPG